MFLMQRCRHVKYMHVQVFAGYVNYCMMQAVKLPHYVWCKYCTVLLIFEL